VRPLRLELEGFTSFRERAVLDFEGLDLFAITGPTGVGKSSLIDAMVFALYGQVPRVGGEYRQLLSHGAERATVRLDFAVGEERFRVVRTIRSSGTPPARLERVKPGKTERTEPLADRVKEIAEQVERIVGLDYDGFTRSVVLPQGQFDAFLKGEPKERRKILVALLDLHVYERMHEVVNRRAADARREAEFIAGQLARDYAGATPEALAEKRWGQSAAEAARRAAEATLLEVARLAEAAQAVRAARREADALALEGRQAGDALKSAEAAPAELRARAETVARDRARLGERRAALPGDEDRRALLLGARPQARQLAELHARRQRLREALATHEAALAARRKETRAAEAALAPAEALVAKARERRERARAAREDAHRRHAAHELRRGLQPGEPCPVCTQTVVLLPPGTAPVLAEADRAAAAAEAALESAQARLAEARLAAERARGDAARLEAEAAQGATLLAEATEGLGRLGASLGAAGFSPADLAEPSALVKAIESELAGLERALAERARLTAEDRRLEAEAADVSARLAAAEAQIAAARERLERLVAREGDAREALQAALAALEERAAPAGVALGPVPGRDEADLVEERRRSVQRDLAVHTGAAARLEAEAAELERRLARAAELAGEKKALEARHALADGLARHLRADQFLAYVQEEALRMLAADGSAHLRQLSQGRYSLACESQEFYVVDHWHADSRRSVKTLSGGETFLASLALALALAESLARLSAEGRAGEALESLFLDEGFGSLDGETLDVVVQAIESLQGGQRMVGIVTHIPELADRMPARLEVRREGRSATARVV